MASTAASYNPSRDDFAAMLDESFESGNLHEGSVIKGIVVGIEKDVAVIDVGLKTEGRVALKEFAAPGEEPKIKIGDIVEVYLERVENALGEAMLSREKAKREESWNVITRIATGTGITYSSSFVYMSATYITIVRAARSAPSVSALVRSVRGEFNWNAPSYG